MPRKLMPNKVCRWKSEPRIEIVVKTIKQIILSDALTV